MGDIKRNKFLFSVNEKGIFEKEVDKAVLDERADFAVHSIKDIPTELDGDLVIASILKRESPNDVLIGKSKIRAQTTAKKFSCWNQQFKEGCTNKKEES